MQAKKQGTSSPSAAARSTTPARTNPKPPLRESAFSAHFLEKVRRREACAPPEAYLSGTALTRSARWRGPWEVEQVPSGTVHLHAATRRAEPAACSGGGGGGARIAARERQEALLCAASFVGLATPNRLHLNTEKKSGRRSPLGHPIHDGARHLGHVSTVVEGSEEAFLASYHVLRCLAADPDALALLLEALDPETLAILGRTLIRKLG